MPGGTHRGVPTAPGPFLKKKKKEKGKKEEKKKGHIFRLSKRIDCLPCGPSKLDIVGVSFKRVRGGERGGKKVEERGEKETQTKDNFSP